MQAKTVAQVVAAEAGGKTLKDRFKAMQDVFSAVFNRSVQTGMPTKDIVSVKSQFSAYNSAMPAGTQSLVSMAQRAIDSVLANGPTHKGTYYATANRVGKLPSGLQAEKTSVDGMKYYSDPKNRSIVTAAGAKKPTVNVSYKTANLPSKTNATPTSRPVRSREIFDNIAAGRNIQVAGPVSPEKYAKAEAPREVDPGPLTRGLSTFDVARAITPAQAQAKVAQERARVAAETQANKSVFTKAGEQIAGVKDSLKGFYDSLTGQTAIAAPHPNAPVNFSTPKTDRLTKTPTATYTDVMAGKPVKTSTIKGIPETKPEAIYDDPRALAYKEDMALQPVNSLRAIPAVDPALAAKVRPDEPVAIEDEIAPTTLARPRVVQKAVRRTPVQITVNRPRSFAPSMPGGTLGDISESERFSVGTGLEGMRNALGGPRGATAVSRSTPGMSYVSRGATLGGFRHNAKTGSTQPVDASGAALGGIHYDDGRSALSHAFGSIFGGGSSSNKGKSSSSSGRSSSSSGRSSNSGRSGNGARGAAGGSLGQSQRSL